MTIGLVWNNAIGEADLSTNDDGSLAEGDPLFTSAIVSLFTRARVVPVSGTVLPSVPQGWWADQYRRRPIGSRLWTLRNAKLNDETLLLARVYAEQALAWWIARGVAKSVTATTAARGSDGLTLAIEAIKTDGTEWAHLWARRLNEL